MLTDAESLRNLRHWITAVDDLGHRITLELITEVGLPHSRLLSSKFGSKASRNLGATQDTAIKIGSNNDYSVCITAVVRAKSAHLIDVWRGKLEFPDLERKAIELARLPRAGTIIIEDKASGQQLLQALRAGSNPRVPKPLGRNPEQDKYSRAAGISSIVESGQLLLPKEAGWLDEFRRELLAFPSSRHDDQVDAL